MAKYPSPANAPSSPVDLSQSDFLGEHVIPRSVVKIAKDQQKLLDRKEAWAYEICKHRQQLYLPPAVFKNLEAFHARKLKARKSKAPCSSHSSQERQVDGGHGDENQAPSSSNPETPPKDKTDDIDDDGNQDAEDDGDSDDERLSHGSWPASPEDHRHPPAVRPRAAEQEELERDEILTQLPPDSSPPRLSPSPPQRRPTFQKPLSSSPGPENELELEIPLALDDSVVPNAIPAQQAVEPMLATPPSAQIIPCTFQQHGLFSRKQDREGQNKQRPVYKKIPELYRPPKAPPTTSCGLGMTRLGPAKPSFTDTQTSTSTTDMSSSSIVPATHRDVPRATSTDDPSPESSHNPPQLHETSELPSAQHIEDKSSHPDPLESPELRHGSPEFIPPSPKLKPVSAPPVTTVQAPPLSPQPVKQPEAPFIEFTLKYPGYTGSISDFVTACAYLETLTGRRRLRPFLFDDFIRAWSEGYLPYVRGCDESDPPVKALNALQWFNEIEDPPVFTKQVVTPASLERILRFYPEEALSARGILRMPRQTTPEAAASKGTQAAKATQPGRTEPPASLKPGAASINRAPQRGTNTSTVADILEEQVPAEASIPTTVRPAARPAAPPSRALPLNKSMDELPREKRPRPTTGELPRSLSEAAATGTVTTSHKRKPSGGDDDNNNSGFQVPAPKKKALSPTPSTAAAAIAAAATTKAASVAPSRPTSSSGGSFYSDVSRATTTTTTGAVSSSGVVAAGRRRFADDPEKRKRKLAKFAKKFREQRKNNDSIVTSSAPVASKP
ncbi:hypothetical protein SLS62_008735 [Diatrype stigma]|uniref:Uncharacterized protein n=1 Tax=Diatrype stigma TaxID=117547 RepID=A0AAN9UHV0_9PEZI